MTNLNKNRSLLKCSSAQLRRARRLWVYLNFEIFWELDKKSMALSAQRAIDRGLYSESTGLTSVVFSIYRHMYRMFCAANPGYHNHGWGWYSFFRDHGFEWFVSRGRAA